jgi:hypothetical protein
VSTLENAISILLVLLGAGSFLYCWFYCFKRMSWKSMGWRDRVTVLSLLLVSLTVLLWPLTRITMPTADWRSGAGVGEQMRWVAGGEKVALRTLLAALILSLCGRPRLILPLVLACVGTGLFWIFSTIP